MATMQRINEYIGYSTNHYFLRHSNLKSYLECYNKRCILDKRMWYIKNIITLFRDKIYHRFIGEFYEKYPNFIIDEWNYEYISKYVLDVHYDDFVFDNNGEDPDMIIVNEFIDELINLPDDKDILRVYCSYYLDCSMNSAIFRMDAYVKIIKTKEKQIRDAKRSIIILNKIPKLNYDVILYISKYIWCKN